MDGQDQNPEHGTSLPKTLEAKQRKSNSSAAQPHKTDSKNSTAATSKRKLSESLPQSVETADTPINDSSAVDAYDHSPNSEDVTEIQKKVSTDKAVKGQARGSSSGDARDDHKDEAYEGNDAWSYDKFTRSE